MKPQPHPPVLAWLGAKENECFLSAITVGEIERGIALLPSGPKKIRLQRALREVLSVMEQRILSFDLDVARRWALLTVQAERAGRTLPVFGSMIEAIALRWELTVVTRNVSDFFEVKTLNPW